MRLAATVVALVTMCIGGLALAEPAGSLPPYRDPSVSIEARVQDLLNRMTFEEKLNQIRSDDRRDIWEVGARTTGFGEVFDILRPLETRQAAELSNRVQRLARRGRLHIPIIIRDEALHGLISNGATSFPQSIAMAATWDPALVGRVADAIGHEARLRGVDRVLSPVINVTRDARWGRTEESYGEDPYLSARMAAAYVRAIELRGVATTPKHYVANVGDGGRDSHAIHITEQNLREIYLPPFEAAVREGGARSIMTAYNSLNGVACSANHWLLTDLLKGEWGFTGVVGSDYGAAWGTIGSHHNVGTEAEAAAADINGGLDIEWPSVGLWGKPLEEAIRKGLVSRETVEESARRMLRNKFELGLFDNPFTDPDEAVRVVQGSEHRALALEAARSGMVLLRNRSKTLPLKMSLRSIAVIGQNAKDGMPLGGYSGWNQPTVSVLAGIRARVGANVKVEWARGTQGSPDASAATIPAASYRDLKGEYFANKDLSGQPTLVRNDPQLDFVWTGKSPAAGLPVNDFSARWTGKLIPTETGRCTFNLNSDDGVRLFLNDELMIDNWTVHAPTTDRAEFRVVKGQPVDLRLEYFQAAGESVVRLGWGTTVVPAVDPGITEAVNLARNSDATIVVATIREGEGQDRCFLDLPGSQPALINAVAATGKPTVVVLIAGAPVTMREWSDSADAILDAWYPGQEGGTAIADVLFGDVNPGGKLPITFPRSVGQCPVYYNLEPSGRGYDYVDSTGAPLYPFGYGLSYTTFAYSNLKVSPAKAKALLGQPITVSFDVQNTGAVAGDEVPQLYIHDLVASMVRPMKELKDFTRITLAPGEKKSVTFELPPSKLAFWNAKMQHVVEPGQFDVMIGSSSSDIKLTGSFAVE